MKKLQGNYFLKATQEGVWQSSEQKGTRGKNKQIWERFLLGRDYAD